MGAFSFFHVFFLPGLASLRILKFYVNLQSALLFAVPISLLINYFLIFTCTVFGFDFKIPLFLLFGLSSFVVIFKKNGVKKLLETRIERYSFVELIITTLSWLYFVYFLTRWIKSFGTIIYWWDAYSAWNPWGMSWYNNKIPSNTSQYPQMIPMVYAIGYKFIGNVTVQFFSKIMVTSFPVIAAFASLITGHSSGKNRTIYSAATIAFLYCVNHFLIPLSGYADAPLASIVYLLVLAMTFFRNAEKLEDYQYNLLIFSTILCGFIKPTGAIISVIAPIIIKFLFTNNISFNKLLRTYIVIGITLFTWYGFKQIQFLMGEDHSVLNHIVSTVGIPFSERIPNGIQLFWKDLFENGTSIWIKFLSSILVIVFSLRAFQKRFESVVFVVVAALLFVLWSLITSYDTRNLAFFVPFACLVFGYGVQSVFESQKIFPRKILIKPITLKYPKHLFAIIFVIFAIVGELYLTDEKILSAQKEAVIRYNETHSDQIK